jgi:hypothetical protein
VVVVRDMAFSLGSAAARRLFLETTVGAHRSVVHPSVTWPDGAATRLALVALHVLAAAIVVPALVRHTHD